MVQLTTVSEKKISKTARPRLVDDKKRGGKNRRRKTLLPVVVEGNDDIPDAVTTATKRTLSYTRARVPSRVKIPRARHVRPLRRRQNGEKTGDDDDGGGDDGAFF